jgi:hypothetical protein
LVGRHCTTWTTFSVLFFFFFKKSGCVARLAWNSQSFCLRLLSAGITGVCHHIQLIVINHIFKKAKQQ